MLSSRCTMGKGLTARRLVPCCGTTAPRMVLRTAARHKPGTALHMCSYRPYIMARKLSFDTQGVPAPLHTDLMADSASHHCPPSMSALDSHCTTGEASLRIAWCLMARLRPGWPLRLQRPAWGSPAHV